MEATPSLVDWPEEDRPLLILGLYHLLFGYFTSVALYARVLGKDPLSPEDAAHAPRLPAPGRRPPAAGRQRAVALTLGDSQRCSQGRISAFTSEDRLCPSSATGTKQEAIRSTVLRVRGTEARHGVFDAGERDRPVALAGEEQQQAWWIAIGMPDRLARRDLDRVVGIRAPACRSAASVGRRRAPATRT